MGTDRSSNFSFEDLEVFHLLLALATLERKWKRRGLAHQWKFDVEAAAQACLNEDDRHSVTSSLAKIGENLSQASSVAAK